MTANSKHQAWQIGLIIGFWPIVLFALFNDSAWLYAQSFNGQIISNIAAPLYFGLMLYHLRPDQRLIALVFVPFSALGEYVFSLLLELYSYKFEAIPIYVPFGHAILLSTGLLISELAWVKQREKQLRWSLLLGHVSLFIGAFLLFDDSLSLLFGLGFSLILLLYRAQLLHLIMGFLVLYIELLGTWLGCWRWDLNPLNGLLHTTNPPVGAFVCYVIADIIVIMSLRWLRWMRGYRRNPHAKGSAAYYQQKLALTQQIYAEQGGKSAISNDDGFGKGYALGTVGLRYVELNQDSAAITCFERTRQLAQSRNDQAIFHLAGWHLGQILLQQGQEHEAMTLLQAYVNYLQASNSTQAEHFAAQLAQAQPNTNDNSSSAVLR
ncbi:MAG TPA: hypothetical protein DEF47_11205 [Herpetosiphon sp.]|uniref:Tetratricopeptide repeat protein n=1 Tax=Herpetosiphon aurantiacus (strain ATCC 23779 / DSM 785 / 114-95) TaxID=316274 RepID=A9AXS9_HERA2|nr:hypothetical protein [Herpetosiphon sp.]ABX04895.1 hypothetical protein Haur_2255 [Herpetosiphon aurantiacus DSM 785]HBW50462.1 hypothetical protein [Herpetosiphon sp.]